MDHEIHALRGHSSELAQLEFSPDGERIETVDVRGYRHVWEVRSGNEIETSENRDRNIAPRIRQSYSSDGRLFVYGADHDVVLVDLQFKHTPREMTFRQSKAKPDAWWHLKQASSAEESRNWYAATFHRAWVVRSLELSGRVEDERFADAPDALLHAYAAWRESRQDTPANELPDPDILLHPIVREVLRSMSVSD
jgi:WD40 repeat protein